MVRTAYSVIAIVILAASASRAAEEFVCHDEQAKLLRKEISSAWYAYDESNQANEFLDTLKGIADRASRPEDLAVRWLACHWIIGTLVDHDLVESRQADLDSCPEDYVTQQLEFKGAHDLAYSRDPELPVVRIKPVYPDEAWEQGLSGWVVVEFTVTKKGRPRKLSVVESSDEVFERSALAATKGIRYKPRMENGKPVNLTGKRDRIKFDYVYETYEDQCGYF